MSLIIKLLQYPTLASSVPRALSFRVSRYSPYTFTTHKYNYFPPQNKYPRPCVSSYILLSFPNHTHAFPTGQKTTIPVPAHFKAHHSGQISAISVQIWRTTRHSGQEATISVQICQTTRHSGQKATISVQNAVTAGYREAEQRRPVAAGTEIGSTSGQKRAVRVTLLSLYQAYGNAETLTFLG